MIRHMDFIKFGQLVTQETKDGIFADLAALVDQIEGTLDFQLRANISPETAIVRGFLDVFWFDFLSAETRDDYLENATHIAIGSRLVAAAGGVEGIFVCDFEL